MSRIATLSINGSPEVQEVLEALRQGPVGQDGLPVAYRHHRRPRLRHPAVIAVSGRAGRFAPVRRLDCRQSRHRLSGAVLCVAGAVAVASGLRHRRHYPLRRQAGVGVGRCSRLLTCGVRTGERRRARFGAGVWVHGGCHGGVDGAELLGVLAGQVTRTQLETGKGLHLDNFNQGSNPMKRNQLNALTATVLRLLDETMPGRCIGSTPPEDCTPAALAALERLRERLPDDLRPDSRAALPATARRAPRRTLCNGVPARSNPGRSRGGNAEAMTMPRQGRGGRSRDGSHGHERKRAGQCGTRHWPALVAPMKGTNHAREYHEPADRGRHDGWLRRRPSVHPVRNRLARHDDVSASRVCRLRQARHEGGSPAQRQRRVSHLGKLPRLPS